MNDPKEPDLPGKGQFLVYRTEDGRVKIDVRLEGETAWLTQAHMAELFQTTVPNVSMHLRNVFAEGELQADSVIQEFLTTATDGKKYTTKYYNLDAIISVGYRVKSAVATRFRIWATQPESIEFFQTVQNKMHWAITGQTAAEIIHARADSAKPNMGLTSWRGAEVRKEDVTIAKNYLSEPELAALNNLVEKYLVFAEGQAMRRVPMHMRDWIAKLHAFLTINDRNILTHAGKISHRMARELAEVEYDQFNRQRIHQADAAGGEFEKAIKQLPPPPKPKTKRGKK
jgi:hypothetical protein